MSHVASSSATLARARRRVRSASRQRGAIFVEACIVSAMLMIFFASAVFFHSLYANKMRATRDARLAAWQPALEGCPSGLGLPQLFNLIPIDSCITSSDCSVGGITPEAERGPDWLDVGSKTGELARAVTSDEIIGGRSYTARAYNRVICNERQQSQRGDLLTIGSYLLDAVIP